MNHVITIRPAHLDDAESIHKLQLRSVGTLCSAAHSDEHMKAWLTNRSPRMYVFGLEGGGMYIAECEGKPVGFGHAENGEIQAIFVDPDWVRRSVGKQLLEHGIEMVSSDGREVFLKATLNAVGFYESHGFVRKGPGSFDCNGVDIPAVRMTRQLH